MQEIEIKLCIKHSKQSGIIKIMIDELEIRISYTETQIKNTEKELRKVQDELKFYEGSLIAYKDLLDHCRKNETQKWKNLV